MKSALVFDIRGPYAHYKKNYSPVSPVTFPCPTPTAMIGMIAGMIGEQKREYLARFSGDQWRLGIQLLKPVQKYRAAINLVNTKLDPKTFRLKGKSARIQIPYEFLKDVAYRIYFWHADDSLFEQVNKQLETETTVYTPSLGLAQCIADVEYVGQFDCEHITDKEHVNIDSIVPFNDSVEIKFENSKRYQRISVPVAMEPGRIVNKYQTAVVEENAGFISARNATPFKCGKSVVSFFESHV